MLNNEFPPLGGGTGTVTENIIRQLATTEDVQIDLITSSLSKNTYEEQDYLPNVRIFKVPVNNQNIHHSTNRELIAYVWGALRLSLKLIHQAPYDVCVAFCTVPAGGVALALWYLYHLPFIVRVSGPDIPGFEQRYALVTTLLGPFIRLTWCKAERVVVKCAHEQAMVTRAFAQARIVTIPNAVDLEKFTRYCL
ncbi:MAG: glycosyltransferase [Chloroflexi bacterium]|nr:glycosyltransferase [Chloroflexota bacterium]